MRIAILLVLSACGAERVAEPTDPAKPAAAAEPVAPVAVGAAPEAAAPAAKPGPAVPPELDPRFVAKIRAAAPAYARWGRVDERPNIAPGLCRMPTPDDYGRPSRPRMSEADEALHGRKLYYLWASDRHAYLTHTPKAQPIAKGFTIVKESFEARPTAPPAPPAPEARFQIETPGVPPPIRTLEHEGTWLEVGTPTGLYVMTKVASTEAPGTDAGWIYGTIAIDGTVTSAGRVSSCMGCHEHAPADRLFGLASPPTR